MSLVGNLEDLGLGDILQIVSLSRKSGILSLQSRGREGKVVFHNGQVIRATSSVFRENLGDLLLRKGLVDIETLKKALAIQQQSPQSLRVGAILSEHFGVALDTIEAIVKEQVEKIVYSFFGWTDGTFSFALGEPEEQAATRFNPLQFMLEQGLNPQWLAMEGSRLLDERLHRGESLEEGDQDQGTYLDYESLLGISPDVPSAPAPAAEEPPSAVSSSRTLLLVDDDETTRTHFERILRAHGFEVQSSANSADMLASIESTVARGVTPVLLVDLFMPRMDGSGILGGLELLEQVRKRFPGLPVLVLSDHPNDDAERRVFQFGVTSIVQKPKKSELRDARGVRALELLGERLLPMIDQLTSGTSLTVPAPATINLGAELMREFGESSEDLRPHKGPETPGLHLLRGMLQELNNPGLGGGIILLVLRFASELMNRAVIFLVKEDEIVGLGQFGIESTDEIADVRVRRMKIPRRQDAVLEHVLREMAPLKTTVGNGYWDRYLVEQLGGGEPAEVFLGPIISEGKVVAVLYGDNLPAKTAIGDTESLEIFLSQAGMAMEKALLERRLRGKESAA